MDKAATTSPYTDLMRPGSFVGAALTASGIKKAFIIFHGIAGCNIEAVHFRSDQVPGGGYVPIIPTGLNEHDCIQGGNEKLLRTLRDTIAQAQKKNRQPDVVFVLTSDATSIVGDDIQSAARVVEEETGVKIIALDTPGFIGGTAKGVDIALTGLLEKNNVGANTQVRPDNEGRHKGLPLHENDVIGQKSGVNIIAPYLMGSKNWTNDNDEIVRLLEGAGITVNTVLARNLNIKELDKFAQAEYNLNLSGEGIPSFEETSAKYGVNAYRKNLPLPIGAANTEEWLLGIAQDIGNLDNAKEILVADQKFVQKQLRFNYNFSWMSTLMYQKRCGLLANAKFGASLARCLLWDFGIVPRVIGLVAETDMAIEQAMELLEAIEGQADVKVLVNPTYFEYGNAIKDAKVDFSIGSIHDKALCMGHKIPHLSLCGFHFFNQYNFIPYPNMGIRGVLGLLTELSRIMEETFYIRDTISAP